MTNNKIKIIDVAGTSQGAYRLLRNRVKKINEDGRFINYIITPKGNYNEIMKKEQIPIIEVDFTRKINMQIFSEIKILRNIIKEIQPNIVHSHSSKGGALARLAVSRLDNELRSKMKVIHQVHGYHFTKYNGIKKFIFENIEKYLMRYTDYLLFQNKYEYEITNCWKKDKKVKLELIGNGIEINEIKKFRKDDERKETLIVCIARLEPIKNHGYLIEALGYLKNNLRFFDFKVYFIGEGNSKKFETVIKNNKLEENIVFTGVLNKKEVYEILSKSKLSVLASFKEGKPRALMESSVLGVPMVATNVIGTNEVVQHGKTGYLVELDNPKEFAKRMYELLTNEKKWKEFSQNAKKYAEKEFDEDKIIEKLKKIYTEELSNYIT
ncbi:hypothetical protein XO12_05820 [Marinitoga sp. 1154]|uniref:glycosyltransferase n=1 Tax=Marinitoga sp. 1154 TaxID=1643335 RepID=UPI0015862E94|nr:hypothetical protein [Marinitoga sp. 1154]